MKKKNKQPMSSSVFQKAKVNFNIQKFSKFTFFPLQ